MRRVLGFVVVAIVVVACGSHRRGATERAPGERCFPEQIAIERFCIDKYEAYVVELDARGDERPHSPYEMVEGLRVRAKVARGVVPQAYISHVQAADACKNAGKRLCRSDEYVRACRGRDKNAFYPYGGQQRKPGVCNEGKGSFVAAKFGQDFNKLTYKQFNDPSLNRMTGGIAATGEFARCVSPEGAFDLVGNVHEWVDDPADAPGRGHFRGGWYGDAEQNLPGCLYVTSAHELTYHDYSTGFRCCADAAGP
jgi:formylglycine-generating enzyme required for sulfatase activity